MKVQDAHDPFKLYGYKSIYEWLTLQLNLKINGRQIDEMRNVFEPWLGT